MPAGHEAEILAFWGRSAVDFSSIAATLASPPEGPFSHYRGNDGRGGGGA